jgi:two-component system, NtrC family, nitrogen regulation sensor histidine kinase GlnL
LHYFGAINVNGFGTHIMFSAQATSTALLEQLNLAIFVLSEDASILYANSQASALFGQSRKKLIGKKINELPIETSFSISLFERLWSTQQSFIDHDVQWQFVDGRHLITDVNAEYMVLDGKPSCVLQVRNEEAFKRENQERHHKHQLSASRHLVRGLAHEIKNPLGGIRGAAQLLSRHLGDEDLREYTTMIIEQSDRLRDLVDRLLGPNKLPQRSQTNIHTVIDRVVSNSHAHQDNAITIHKDYDPSLPAIHVDAGQIEQAIFNLINNAIQALEPISAEHNTFKPLVMVQTRFVGNKIINEELRKKAIRISIIDNGPGIDDAIKETLFYPMVTSKSNGNGLGLSISHTLIEQHFGQIEVDSRTGHTEFAIYLPL